MLTHRYAIAIRSERSKLRHAHHVVVICRAPKARKACWVRGFVEVVEDDDGHLT